MADLGKKGWIHVLDVELTLDTDTGTGPNTTTPIVSGSPVIIPKGDKKTVNMTAKLFPAGSSVRYTTANPAIAQLVWGNIYPVNSLDVSPSTQTITLQGNAVGNTEIIVSVVHSGSAVELRRISVTVVGKITLDKEEYIVRSKPDPANRAKATATLDGVPTQDLRWLITPQSNNGVKLHQTQNAAESFTLANQLDAWLSGGTAVNNT